MIDLFVEFMYMRISKGSGVESIAISNESVRLGVMLGMWSFGEEFCGGVKGFAEQTHPCYRRRVTITERKVPPPHEYTNASAVGRFRDVHVENASQLDWDSCGWAFIRYSLHSYSIYAFPRLFLTNIYSVISSSNKIVQTSVKSQGSQ